MSNSATFKKIIAISVIIAVIFILFYANKKELLTTDKPATFIQLTEGEKINNLIDRYFRASNVMEYDDDNETKIENKYIDNLPLNSDCEDDFDDCKKWADLGECIVNPEYMLYNCTKSCEACKLSKQEKYNVASIYNSRSPPVCAYHGDIYPNTDMFLDKLYNI